MAPTAERTWPGVPQRPQISQPLDVLNKPLPPPPRPQHQRSDSGSSLSRSQEQPSRIWSAFKPPTSARDVPAEPPRDNDAQARQKLGRLRTLIGRPGQEQSSIGGSTESASNFLYVPEPDQNVAPRSAPSNVTTWEIPWPTLASSRQYREPRPPNNATADGLSRYVSPVSPQVMSATSTYSTQDPWERALANQAAAAVSTVQASSSSSYRQASPAPSSSIRDPAAVFTSNVSPIASTAYYNSTSIAERTIAAPSDHSHYIGTIADLNESTSETNTTETSSTIISNPSDFALFVAATSSLGMAHEDDASSEDSDEFIYIPPPSVTQPHLTRSKTDATPKNHHQGFVSHHHAHSLDFDLEYEDSADSSRWRSGSPAGARFVEVKFPTAQQRSVSQPAPEARVIAGPSSAQQVVDVPPPEEPPIETRTQMIAAALLGLEQIVPEREGDDEEELPDYFTSQQEAHARQRWGAAQRAKELDEAWRRGKRRH